MDEQAKPKMSLVLKLAAIMAGLERVPKSGRNDFHKYDYATEADITAAVRRGLGEAGILMVPSVVKVEWKDLPRKNGGADRLCTLTVRFTLRDCDSGETLAFEMLGEGSDATDKASYKAMTGAVKYALLKLFLMSTGDDPEREEEPARPQKPQRQKSEQAEGPSEEQKTRMAVIVDAMKKAGLANSREAVGTFIRNVSHEPYHRWTADTWHALTVAVATAASKAPSAEAPTRASSPDAPAPGTTSSVGPNPAASAGATPTQAPSEVAISFGDFKGVPVASASDAQLSAALDAGNAKLAEQPKARWAVAMRANLGAIEIELQHRSLRRGEPGSNG